MLLKPGNELGEPPNALARAAATVAVAIGASATAMVTTLAEATPSPIVAAGTVTVPTVASELQLDIAYGGLTLGMSANPALYGEEVGGLMKDVNVPTSLNGYTGNSLWFYENRNLFSPGPYHVLNQSSLGGKSYAVSDGAVSSARYQLLNVARLGAEPSLSYSGAGAGAVLKDENQFITNRSFLGGENALWSVTVPQNATSANATISGQFSLNADIVCGGGGGICQSGYFAKMGLYDGAGFYAPLLDLSQTIKGEGSHQVTRSFNLDLSSFSGRTLDLYVGIGDSAYVASNAVFGPQNSISRDYNLISSIPEPSTYGLMAVGGLALAGLVRRRQSGQGARGSSANTARKQDMCNQTKALASDIADELVEYALKNWRYP